MSESNDVVGKSTSFVVYVHIENRALKRPGLELRKNRTVG